MKIILGLSLSLFVINSTRLSDFRWTVMFSFGVISLKIEGLKRQSSLNGRANHKYIRPRFPNGLKFRGWTVEECRQCNLYQDKEVEWVTTP